MIKSDHFLYCTLFKMIGKDKLLELPGQYNFCYIFSRNITLPFTSQYLEYHFIDQHLSHYVAHKQTINKRSTYTPSL